MLHVNLDNLKVIKNQLYSRLEDEKPNYHLIATLSMEFKKYINFWAHSNKTKSWEDFTQASHSIGVDQDEIIDCALLGRLAIDCYYKKQLSKKEAFLYLKNVYIFEKQLLSLDTTEPIRIIELDAQETSVETLKKVA